MGRTRRKDEPDTKNPFTGRTEYHRPTRAFKDKKREYEEEALEDELDEILEEYDNI